MGVGGHEHLTPTMIEAVARGADAEGEAAAHLRSCGACRDAVRSTREEHEYLDRVRVLASGGLGPEDAPRAPGYKIVARVGSGSQAVVYRAIQASTARVVAIKVLHPGASERSGWRAAHEAEIAAGLRHPGLVTVYESLVLDDGRTATVMEFVEGEPIDRWLGEGGPSEQRVARALGVFTRVCEAIHHAHLNGVIHRDIKPENVLVDPDGNPVVLDFGVARRGETWRTHAGEIAGTPAYASPEQMSGEPDTIDALTDVYSLGVLLYKLLSGRLPYDLDGPLAKIAATIVGAPPTPLRRAAPSIRPDLEAVVMRAIQKDKARRYQSAAALGADARRYLLNQPVEARGESGWYLMQKLASRYRRRVAIIVAGIALAGLASAVIVRSMSEAAAADRRAAQQREHARLDHLRLRAVTELMRLMMPPTDPKHPEVGASVSAGLGRLYFRLETGAYADEPELDQEIRRLWGGVYTGLGTGRGTEFVEYAEVALRSGLVRLRRQDPGGETPEIAAAVHELAGVLLVRGRLGEAVRLAQEDIALHRRLYGGQSREAARSIALLARILAAQDRVDEAARTADEAIAALGASATPDADLVLSAMTSIKARSALVGGDAESAERWVLDALRVRLRRSLPDDAGLHESLEQAAELYELAPNAPLSEEVGRIWGGAGAGPAELLRRDVAAMSTPVVSLSVGQVSVEGRTEAIGRLLRLQEHVLGPDSPAVVGFLMTQNHTAWAERSLETRADVLLRAADILAKRFGESDLAVLVCVEEAASVDAYAGRVGRAAELGGRADAIWRSYPEGVRDDLLAANTRRKLAWYLDLAGRHAEAEGMYGLAIGEFTGLVGEDHYLVALTLGGLAVCLAESGDLAGAEAHSAEALAVLGRADKTPADTTAHIRFARGHVLWRLGRFAEARPYFEDAWAGFYGVSGDLPWKSMLLSELADSCERLGDADAAAGWRATPGTAPAAAEGG